MIKYLGCLNPHMDLNHSTKKDGFESIGTGISLFIKKSNLRQNKVSCFGAATGWDLRDVLPTPCPPYKYRYIY